jgi:nitrogen fixation NifU-like protein
MSDELYHRKLVARARGAVGKGKLDAPDGRATIDNPLCGDRVTMEVKLADGRLAAVAHQTRGCLLCEAAAALIGAEAAGERLSDVDAAIAAAKSVVEGAPAPAGRWSALEEFGPVRAAKSRRDCVLLPFRALAEAIAAARGTTS